MLLLEDMLRYKNKTEISWLEESSFKQHLWMQLSKQWKLSEELKFRTMLLAVVCRESAGANNISNNKSSHCRAATSTVVSLFDVGD